MRKETVLKVQYVLQIEIDSCPLEWWKEHEAKFPHLSRDAREMLALLHPINEFFCSNLLYNERLSLGGDVANACLFLSFNSKANRRNEFV